MDDPLCRVTVQCADAPGVVDLALPRHARVGLLLPDIVDLVIGTDSTGSVPRGWRLDRICGGRCDESLSLHESGVSDGAVMVLAPVTAPGPGPLHPDLFRTVAAGDDESEPRPRLRVGFWMCGGMIAVLALGYSGARSVTPMTAAAAALIGAAACIMLTRRDQVMGSVLDGIAVGFVCIGGFLAVPGDTVVPGAVLGTAAASATSVWLLRAGAGSIPLLTGTATAFALGTAAMSVSVILSADLAVAAAILAALSLGTLGAAGRLAMLTTGLRPAFPGDRLDDAAPAITADIAGHGRAVCTGLVAGSIAAATCAVIMIVGVGLSDPARWPQALALAGVIAALLALRSRFHPDPPGRAATGWGGLISTAAAVALAADSAPLHTGPVVVSAFCVAVLLRTGPGERGPFWARCLDITEYVLMATVVPLACWVGGLYGLVRTLSVG